MTGAKLPGGAIGFGVDAIFFPLAILGLLRLCAATWLTEDFVYQRDSLRNILTTETATQVTTDDNDIELDCPSKALDPLITTTFKTAGFRDPAHSWRSRFFRCFFLSLLGGVWTLDLLITVPIFGNLYFTTTTFLLDLFYFLFTTVSLILYTFYFFRGQTTTTILPCISSTWYRLYTLLLMSLMIALVVIASIETNKGPTGIYTSVSLETNLACANFDSEWWQLPPAASRWIGFATDEKLGEGWLTKNQAGLPVTGVKENGSSAEFWLYNFTGYCVGVINDM
ncbi:hypothetical protein G6011_04313 [Alternaria panax]|uniref:Uncharacterized protein n=1 Tax=Alternaria panax TaxID=48097 RepID=A0AAD4IH02_9PLEO|nr:hypothetical protein G6011_04313 [Alternaria panax]